VVVEGAGVRMELTVDEVDLSRDWRLESENGMRSRARLYRALKVRLSLFLSSESSVQLLNSFEINMDLSRCEMIVGR
jgi:hypothetical protein